MYLANRQLTGESTQYGAIIRSGSGNLTGVAVLPTSAVLSVPAGVAPAEAASRPGAPFAVHGSLKMSKGLWLLSLEMFDTHLQRVCFSRKRDLELNRPGHHHKSLRPNCTCRELVDVDVITPAVGDGSPVAAAYTTGFGALRLV